MKNLVVVVLLFSLSNSYAQDERRLFFGVNVGTKIANKNYASRYAGWYNNQLVNQMMSNTYNYNAIFNLLGQYDFYLPYDYAPQNMKYSPGLLTGVMVGFKLSPTIQMSLDANFNTIKTRDVFSVVVNDPSISTTQEQYQLGELFGKESRFNGKYNIDYIVEGDKVNFIIGVSGIFSAWRMDQHTATFPSGQYSMQLYSRHDPTNNITNKVTDIGWGAGVNLGLEYRLNEQFVLQGLYQPHHVQLDMGIVPGRTILLQHDIVLRILWK